MPYISQKQTLHVKMIYIEREISFMCFVLMTCIACGKNEHVVRTAANKESCNPLQGFPDRKLTEIIFNICKVFHRKKRIILFFLVLHFKSQGRV